MKKKKAKKIPKLRAWGKPLEHRKVMTQVILSKKEKLQKRTARKRQLHEIIQTEI